MFFASVERTYALDQGNLYIYSQGQQFRQAAAYNCEASLMYWSRKIYSEVSLVLYMCDVLAPMKHNDWMRVLVPLTSCFTVPITVF